MARSDTDLVHRVARAIAARRRALGLTQEALAERLELATKNVQRIESGIQNLTLATLDRIASALETSPGALLGGTIAPVPVATSGPVTKLVAAGYRVRPANAPGRRSTLAVPLTTIRAAAGALQGGARAVEALGWVTLSRKSPPPDGQFIAQVAGHSMEPRFPDGAICLFGPAHAPPFGDRIFLVAHSALDESGLEGPFALKQVEAKKRRITLRSLNPKYPPLEIDDRRGELRIIAELVELLVKPDASS